MTDEREPKVSQRYRELPGEEPSRELDQHILAAAHRATDPSHAPLVAPAGRHRWYFSLAAAAVLVFAVAITLHVERQQPDLEAVSPPPAPEAPMRDAEKGEAKKSEPPPPPAAVQERRAAPKRAPSPPRFTPEPPPQTSSPADAVGAASVPPASAPPERALESNRMRQAPRQDAEAERRAQSRSAPSVAARSAPAPAAGQLGSVLAERAADTPEGELERIARLRRGGRDDEADKALAEFRKRYPDYRISAEMRAKVERPVPASR